MSSDRHEPSTRIPWPTQIRLSAKHGCDTRSITKIAAGGVVRGRAGERARAAYEEWLAEQAETRIAS